MVKMTLTFDEETIETLRDKAKKEGFIRPSLLARYLLLRSLRESAPAEIEESQDTKTITVQVKNYRALKAYVDAKRLGSLEVLATFAMEQYMTRYPLKTASGCPGGKSTGD